MDDKKLKTEGAPASLRPGLVEAQQVISTIKIRQNQIRPKAHRSWKKKLAEHNRRVREERKRKKGGSKQPEDPKDPGPEGQAPHV